MRLWRGSRPSCARRALGSALVDALVACAAEVQRQQVEQAVRAVLVAEAVLAVDEHRPERGALRQLTDQTPSVPIGMTNTPSGR